MLTIEIDPSMPPVFGYRYAQPDELIQVGWARWEDDPVVPGVDPVPPELVGKRARETDLTWMVPWPEDPRLPGNAPPVTPPPPGPPVP